MMLPGRRDRIVRRGNVACGQGRDSQTPRSRGPRKNPPSSAAASMAAFGRGPGRARVPMVRQHVGLG